MQRIGRVDRRLNPAIEDELIANHPDVKELRGGVAYWNFLPPEELDGLLLLYQKVSHKTLRISKTFGIEGKKLLRPEDDYEALKEFNQAYEGTPSATEAMKLDYQRLLAENPDLEHRLNQLPGRVFSGKQHPSKNAKAVFFCYALPAAPATISDAQQAEATAWTEATGATAWYLFDLDKQAIIEEPTEIQRAIRSKPNTPRHRSLPDPTLSEIRKKIEGHIKNTYLKRVQAPVGVKATLKAWMELS
jgi:hypothetical protein